MRRSIGSTSKYLLYRNSLLLSQNYILSNSAVIRTNNFWSSNFNTICYYTTDQPTSNASSKYQENSPGNFSKTSSEDESSLSGGYGGTTGYQNKFNEPKEKSSTSGSKVKKSESSGKQDVETSSSTSSGSPESSTKKSSSSIKYTSNFGEDRGYTGTKPTANEKTSTATTTPPPPKSSNTQRPTGARSFATTEEPNIGKGVGGTHGFSDAKVTSTGRETEKPEPMNDREYYRYVSSAGEGSTKPTYNVKDFYPTQGSTVRTDSMIYSANIPREGDYPRDEFTTYNATQEIRTEESSGSTLNSTATSTPNSSSTSSANDTPSSSSEAGSSTTEKKTIDYNVDRSTYTAGMAGGRSAASSMRGNRTETTWKGEMPPLSDGLKEVVKSVGKLLGNEKLEPENLKNTATDIANKIKGTVKKNIGWALGSEKLQEAGKRDLESQERTEKKENAKDESSTKSSEENNQSSPPNESLRNKEEYEFDRYDKDSSKDKSEFNRYDTNSDRDKSEFNRYSEDENKKSEQYTNQYIPDSPPRSGTSKRF